MARSKGARANDYDAKRATLLRRMGLRLGRRNQTRPSLRQLAEAAEVSVPTLRHYFGGRDEIVLAIFEEYRRLGESFVLESAVAKGDLPASVGAFLSSLTRGIQHGPLGELFAIGFVEGLMNERLGPACLELMVDPAVDALTRRLEAHQEKGEMRQGDARHAALMLIAPMLLACHHQQQLFGREKSPLAMQDLANDLLESFLRSYAVPN